MSPPLRASLKCYQSDCFFMVLEPTDLRASRTSPLPPIGQTGSGPRGGDAAQPKQPPIVFITGESTGEMY